MTINEYLKKHKLTAEQFAKKAKISVSSVNKWRTKNRSPGGRNILKIERATLGSVQLRDWY
jgi:transcriptional regulator with XRE-family HTH domain